MRGLRQVPTIIAPPAQHLEADLGLSLTTPAELADLIKHDLSILYGTIELLQGQMELPEDLGNLST
jgi:hypothetical protein